MIYLFLNLYFIVLLARAHNQETILQTSLKKKKEKKKLCLAVIQKAMSFIEAIEKQYNS